MAEVRVRSDGPVTYVGIDNPPDNRLTVALVADLARCVAEFDASDVRAIVLAGVGPDFSAGTDLDELGKMEPRQVTEYAKLGQDAAWKIEHGGKPWIAAIEGRCFGGGQDLALACDIRVASETAVFARPEVDAGWIPMFGGTARLLRAAGKATAAELLWTGRTMAAAEAKRAGLVNWVAPSGTAREAAEELARDLSAKSAQAVRAVKRVLAEQLDKPYRNGFIVEAQFVSQLAHGRKAGP